MADVLKIHDMFGDAEGICLRIAAYLSNPVLTRAANRRSKFTLVRHGGRRAAHAHSLP